MSPPESPSAFVTVGTTRFDPLVRTATRDRVLRALAEAGYKTLVVQAGRLASEIDWLEAEKRAQSQGLALHHFDYKPSLQLDLAKASLVISHAGAGTCLDVLEAPVPPTGRRRFHIVVVNKALMDNHQTELAKRLEKDRRLRYCDSGHDLEGRLAGLIIGGDDRGTSEEAWQEGDAEAFRAIVRGALKSW